MVSGLGIKDTLVYQQMKQDMFNGEFVSWSVVDTPEEFSIKRKRPCAICGHATTPCPYWFVARWYLYG